VWEEKDVVVRYPEQERKSLGNVKEMRIRTSGGKEVPFSQVAEVKMEHGYASIQRAQRLRVVNDSLVLIDAINRLRSEGVSAREAVTRAAALRFRAIILTSLTTFAGLSPMIMEKSLHAQFLIPMAVSLGFGVLFATGITLLLVPSGYVILEDLKNLLTSQKAKITTGEAD